MDSDAEYKSFATNSISTPEVLKNLNFELAGALKIALPLMVPVAHGYTALCVDECAIKASNGTT